HAIDQDCRAAGAIAFIADLFVCSAVTTARATLNGALDVVLGHVGSGGLVPGQPQAGVRFRVGTTCSCCHGDFADDFCPELTALGVLPPLAVLDVRPFTVSGHIFVDKKLEKLDFPPWSRLTTCDCA